MPLNLTWVTFSAIEGEVHPGQIKRQLKPFQVEAALKYLVVPLTFAHDCTYRIVNDVQGDTNLNSFSEEEKIICVFPK